MGMPTKNYMFKEVAAIKACDVRLEGNVNKYYVATINGKRGVVTMDGQHRFEQQRRLDRMVANTKRRNLR